MRLRELLSSITTLQVIGNDDIEITDLQFDSRRVQRGSLFVAQVGTAVDGHKFIGQCLDKGATAVVCERTDDIPATEACIIVVENSDEALGKLACRFYGEPSRKLTLVGVTGTNGKTTIATLLYRLTLAMGHRAGLLSTVCNYVNDEPIAATHTTPDSLELNSLLRRMVDSGCEYAFMEVSSHAIAQQRIAGLDFDGAIFTNLTRDHIDYHKTFDNYRDTKKRLFDGLKPEAFAITNKDDRNGLFMVQNTKAHVSTYSTRTLADARARIIEEGFEGMLIEINRQEVSVPLVGRFNVSNLLAIYSAAICLGFDKQEVLRVISTLSSVNGRFETIRSDKGWTAIIDYAHTPDALENVINTINQIRNTNPNSYGRLITITGCGGNRDKGKRPMMAAIAAKLSDLVIFTSDNPREEDPQDIINDMLEGLSEKQRQAALIILDRRQAIRTACTIAQKGDIVLVAGKGHEDYQVIGTTKHHFDDHEEVRAMI